MARPKVYEEARTSTAVRLPASLHARLNLEAAERDVSVNLIILKAVEQYLNRANQTDPLVPTESKEAPIEPPKAGVPTMDLLESPRRGRLETKRAVRVGVTPRFKK